MIPKSVTPSYRAAVIGCGRIGYSFGGASAHAGSYIAVDGVDLVAVCDCKQEQVGRCAKDLGVNAYQDYLKMLESERLDIISICTPPDTHCQVLHSVVEYDSVKAIYCEKPIATSHAVAEYMVQICAERGILLMVNHQRRFSPLHQEITRIIREGELGCIQQVTCYYGGGVANTGSHLFDLLRFYFGDVRQVDGWWSLSASHKPTDPNVDGLLRFDKDVPVVLQACDSYAYALFEINILGTLGRLRVGKSGYQAEIEWAAGSPNLTGARELQRPLVLSKSIPRESPNDWIPCGIRHILDCLETGKQPISSGEDGLAALKIIEAVTTSARQKGE